MKRIIVAIILAILTVAFALVVIKTNMPQKTELVFYQWDKVDVLKTESELDGILAGQRAWIKERLAKGAPYTWENFVLPLSEMDEQLRQIAMPIDHLSSVLKPEESLREKHAAAFAKVQEKLTQFGLELAQSKEMYEAYKSVSDGAEQASLSPEQKMSLQNTLRDYRLSGILLSDQKKKELTAIAVELDALSKKFSDNSVYSTDAWKKHVTDERTLDGLPDSIKATAKDAAIKQHTDGYMLDLQDSTVMTILSFAKNRELRREVYQALYTIASRSGPGGEKFDNAPIIEKILELRYKEARILGFNNYAEMALSTRMAENTGQVMDFLNDLKVRSRPFAESQFKELADFARAKDGLQKLEPWDSGYYLQLMKKEKFSFSDEDFRPYFPVTKVIDGLGQVANKLYGISLRERTGVPVWHPDVKFYEVYGKDGKLIGGLYVDLFQREGKSGGGWANALVGRYQKSDGSIQLPVGLIVLNFRPPEQGQDALLGLQDVTYIFHEFGHNMQFLLTKVSARDVAGINGVPWDGVELASQFNENFVWQPEVLDMFAAHYQTGEKLPAALIEKAREMRTFGKGLALSRQLIPSIFDFRLHMEYVPGEKGMTSNVYDKVYREISPMPFYSWMKTFPNNFGHVFAGGYSAGYYSYLWAEVLSADDFSPFLKNGKIDWSVGKKFEDEILSRGGSRPFMESNTAFLGRKPSVDALMNQYGFATSL